MPLFHPAGGVPPRDWGLGTALPRGRCAVIPVLPVVDTIKTVDASAVVTGTPARSSMRAVQTPAGSSRWRRYWRLMSVAEPLPPEEAEALTDDAMAMEATRRTGADSGRARGRLNVTTPWI